MYWGFFSSCLPEDVLDCPVMKHWRTGVCFHFMRHYILTSIAALCNTRKTITSIWLLRTIRSFGQQGILF